MPTMGWFSLMAPVDPEKGASKAKMPPSEATSQYPEPPPAGGCVGASSSTMVPTPWASARAATLVGLDRLTSNVSFGSSTPSPCTGTTTVLEVSPGAKLTVPEVEV